MEKNQAYGYELITKVFFLVMSVRKNLSRFLFFTTSKGRILNFILRKTKCPENK